VSGQLPEFSLKRIASWPHVCRAALLFIRQFPVPGTIAVRAVSRGNPKEYDMSQILASVYRFPVPPAYVLAEDHDPREFLQDVWEPFALANQLGYLMQSQMRSGLQLTPEEIEERRALFVSLMQETLRFRDLPQACPPQYAAMGRIVLRTLRQLRVMRKQFLTGPFYWVDLVQGAPHLVSYSHDAWHAYRAITRDLKLDDPFAFLDAIPEESEELDQVNCLPVELDTPEEPETSNPPGPCVASWDELGIGLDADRILAFIPAPEPGALVAIGSGHVVTLAGPQRLALLEAFSESPDGRTLTRKEVLDVLPRAPRGIGAIRRNKQSHSSVFLDELPNVQSPDQDRVAAAIDDLNRAICDEIGGPRGVGKPPISRNRDTIQARLIVRCLIRDDNYRYRFGHRTTDWAG
jgi:hypothetical protein